MIEQGRIEITSKKAREDGLPEPIWWAKACRQLGIEPDIREVRDSNNVSVAVSLPDVPVHIYEALHERARLLAERDKKGLPTEEKPSGGFPDSDDEVADPFALRVWADDGGKVCLDLGRAVRAVSIHPVAALHLSTLLTTAAFSIEAALEDGLSKDMKVQVATVKGIDGEVREAVVRLPSPFAEDDGEEGENGGDVS